MTLVVDPPLSVTDILKLADDIRATLKTTLPHWRAYMWKQCRPQATRDLIIIHTPNINTITEPPTSNSRPTRCRQLPVQASSPVKRSAKSVTTRLGAKPCCLSNFTMSFFAACASRLRWTRKSSTSPSLSTARHSQYLIGR